jgi:hypothetical protein
MNWEAHKRSFPFRIVYTMAAAFGASLAMAAPPPGNAQFLSPVEFKPEYLATLTVAGCLPQGVSSYVVLTELYGGASLDPPVWELRGVFSTRPGRINAGAGLLFLTGIGPTATTPLMELAMLQAGTERDCWELIDTDSVRPIPAAFLQPGLIRDRHDITIGVPEYEAYWNILVQAHYTSTEAFAKAARRDVTYVHLFNEPQRYRGQVVHVSGRLIRLSRYDAPDEARAQGMADLYEGWIMTDAYGKNPVCVAFTELPDGLTVDSERKYNEPVSFDGYSYKRYRYRAADGKLHDVPMLIGHSLAGKFEPGEAGEADTSWGHEVMYGFLAVVLGTVVVVFVLTGWFRYHDRRVRLRLHASRTVHFVAPPDDLGSSDS